MTVATAATVDIARARAIARNVALNVVATLHAHLLGRARFHMAIGTGLALMRTRVCA
jgi:hypothetical protein